MFRYHRNFQSRFTKTPEGVKTKLPLCLQTLITEPHHPILNHHKLTGAFESWHSIDIHGDHRLIFQYLGGQIILHDIGTHTQLYR